MRKIGRGALFQIGIGGDGICLPIINGIGRSCGKYPNFGSWSAARQLDHSIVYGTVVIPQIPTNKNKLGCAANHSSK